MNKTAQLALLTLYLAVHVVVAIVALLQLFGDPTSSVTPASWDLAVPFLARTVFVREDVRMLLISLSMGLLGSAIHTLSSLSDYVGNGSYRPRWGLFYVLRPWIGSLLAVVLYFVLRGGLLGANGGSINPYGVAAVSGLAGMFSKQATDKLKEVFDTLFRTQEDNGDALRGDKLETAPVIAEVHPVELVAGKAAQALEILGHGFASPVMAVVGPRAIVPDRVEAGRIVLTLSGDDVKAPGEIEVSVRSGTVASQPVRILVVPLAQGEATLPSLALADAQ